MCRKSNSNPTLTPQAMGEVEVMVALLLFCSGLPPTTDLRVA